MYLFQYLDENKLAQYLQSGMVDVRHHKTLPLRVFTFSKKAIFENHWDDVTTRCRGLIVGPGDKIIARPFEKFFNVDTSYRPETHLYNLPTRQPTITEKVDGSLGILWEYQGVSGIATKGSFHSEQAEWATKWYHRNCHNGQWPEGYTPVFEIVAESVQHHVVHYYGSEQMILLALINIRTGEEADYNTLYHWAKVNGVNVVDIYNKTLGDVLNEDRKNHEGYVLSWDCPGDVPLKIKVKHENFLALQRVVHSATPKAILEALQANNVDLLNTWIGQTNEPIGQWVKSWVTRFNWKYGEILLKCNTSFRHGLFRAIVYPTVKEGRKEFAEYVKDNVPEYASVCFAMLDGKDHKPVIWKLVEKVFEKELSKPFVTEVVAA